MKITKEWISGFVDGNGDFKVEKNQYIFSVSQNKKSVDVLYALKKEFGCGRVFFEKGKEIEGIDMCHYQMCKAEHVRDKCIPFFHKYPLQTKKKFLFQSWVNSFREEMRMQKKDPGNPAIHNECKISAGWFRGFVETCGCFYANMNCRKKSVKLCFVLAFSEAEENVVQACHSLINCGSVSRSGDFKILQVSLLQDLETKLVPFFETRGSAVLLRTRKRIAFQKFRKIVRLLMEKKHRQPAGFEKVKKYINALKEENI